MRFFTAIFCLSLLVFPTFGQTLENLAPPITESPVGLGPLTTPRLQPAGESSAAETATNVKKPTSSTSSSRQFIVHGKELTTRSAFCSLSDDTAASLSKLLKDAPVSPIPVVVVLKTPPEVSMSGPAVTTNISQLAHGGFHLQMTVQLRPDFKNDDFEKELVRVLLAERILRDHKELNTKRQRVLPDWLLTGVTEAQEFKSRSKPSALFSAVFRSGQIYGIDRILTADPAQLDALARGIYETSSCALVLALLEQPEGPLRFSKFLNALATDDKPDRELLQEYFPTLNISQNSLEKWWTLQMATLSTPTALETMGIAETEAALDTALLVHYEEKSPSKPKTSPAASPPLAQEETPQKKSNGFFGLHFGKGDPDEKKEQTSPPAKSAPKEEPKDDEKKSPFGLPKFLNPFGKSKDVIFPFTKRKSEESAEPETPATPEKPAEVKKELPRKASSSRSVGGKPANLPPETPVEVLPVPADTDGEVPEKKPGFFNPPAGLNPLNWFQNDKEDAPDQDPVPGSLPVPGSMPGETSPIPSRPTPRAAESNTSSHHASVSLEDYQRIWKRSDRAAIFKRTLEHLNALKQRAHPLYKPLVGEYADIALQLSLGKDKGVKAKLETLVEKRHKIQEEAKAVESYLDWFEASQTQYYSGTFDDYLKLRKKLDDEIRPRNDAISKYLDVLAKEFE